MKTSTKRLEQLRDILAKLQGRPPKAWEPRPDGKGSLAVVGALILDHNSIYGGWDLCEMVNESGGEHSLIGNTFAGRGRLKAHEMESFLLGAIFGASGSTYWPMKTAKKEAA